MKIGVRAHDYGRHEIEEYAGLLKEEGYEAVQLAIPKAFTGIESYSDITEDHLYRIREAFEKAGIEITVLGCYMDLGNPDKDVREYAVKTFTDCLRFSKILGARVTGTETAYPALSADEKAVWHPFMMDSLRRLADAAEKTDALMAIEPVYWHPLKDIETTMKVLEEIGSSHLRLIFDPANVFVFPGSTDQKIYWEKCLDAFGPYIEAIHLKDFTQDENGKYIPRPLGEGIMDFGPIFSWLRTNKPDMAILREEMNPAIAAREISFMHRLIRGM